MKHIKFSLLSLIFIILFGIINTNAQSFKILTKGVKGVDDKLVVSYEFTKFKQKQNFNVWLEIKDSKGNKLNIKNVSGDVGENLKGGKNKQIIWDYLADNIVIDDNIGIEVKAELIIPEKTISEITLGKALMLSAVVPGLGLAKTKQNNAFLAFSAITYGTAIMSFVYNKNANNSYNEYISGTELSTESSNFSKSSSQKSMSNIFLYTAIASWTGNMIWTYIAAKNNKSVIGLSDKNKVQFATGVNVYTKTPVFMLTYRF